MKTEKIAIRRARTADFARILELSRKEWPEWWAKNQHLGAEYIRLRINQRTVFLVTSNGRVIGYEIYSTLWSILHLDDIFVEKRYRNRGLATTLVNRLIQDAAREGFRKVMSDTDQDNLVARKFHLRNGFSEVGYIKNLWGNKDSIVFSRFVK